MDYHPSMGYSERNDAEGVTGTLRDSIIEDAHSFAWPGMLSFNPVRCRHLHIGDDKENLI